MQLSEIDVLLLYRGRFHRQIERLDAILGSFDLRVTYDSEILTDDADSMEAEIEWLSLGQSTEGEDVAWRGPLSAAVKRSALVVFLIDPQDPSVNVMNELAWAARAGKPLFVVFNTNADSHSADWEGLNIGFLQAFYGMIKGQPESPAFGYHFVTHDEDEGLDERLTILVNRIVSYLDRVNRGEVGHVRFDKGITHVAELENAPLARARRRLRDVQEKIAKGVGLSAKPDQDDQTEATLELLYQRERDGEVRDGRIFPRHSPFSFPEDSERERYRRTEALVNYVRPGPYESPELLSMYARELVSVQMVLARPVRPTILIGTVPLCPSNIPVDVVLERDFGVLLVDASQTDFVYQMMKATVMAWKIVSPPDQRRVSMSTRVEDTQEVIAANPTLVRGFARSFKQMIETGTPGASTQGAPPVAYHPALTMLGLFAKRFSVAVALARIVRLDSLDEIQKQLHEQLGRTLTRADWLFAADGLAAKWVFDSARFLDVVDSTIALQGILLGLAVQGLIERFIAGLVAPEGVALSARVARIGAFFLRYQAALKISEVDATNALGGAKDVAKTLDLLLQAAIQTGQLDLTDVQPATRWLRHTAR
jgi:hypothetical protein